MRHRRCRNNRSHHRTHMAQLILLVVAAAWLAVLIPPMLRSRVENRPNSSVTDFRRQLTKLQNTATPPRGAVRAMGRPLAPSPLVRPAAGGRPGQPQLRSGVTRHSTPSELAAQANVATLPDLVDEAPRFRSHGDPSGGRRRPAHRQTREHDERLERDDDRGGRPDPRHREQQVHGDMQVRQRQVEAPQRSSSGHRSHGDPSVWAASTPEQRRRAPRPRSPVGKPSWCVERHGRDPHTGQAASV